VTEKKKINTLSMQFQGEFYFISLQSVGGGTTGMKILWSREE